MRQVSPGSHHLRYLDLPLVDGAADDRPGAARGLHGEHVRQRGHATGRDDPPLAEGHERPQQAQVRAAEEPVDLWLLRAPMFAALAGTAPDQRTRRQQLRRSLDSVFPDLEPPSAFGNL